MKTNSDIKPKQIYPLGDGTYHFNYNIEEVIDEEGNKSFYCDTIHVRDISYDNLVSKMIAEKYPINKELALHRQRETRAREFQDYFDYCEECKTIAREALEIPESSDPTDPTVQYKLNELTETINILIDNEE